VRGPIVGFDRKIEKEWLDFAAAQAVAGCSAGEMRGRLWEFLDGRVSAGSSGWNSDRGKVITVLARIWGPGSGRYEELRSRAVEAVAGAPPEQRLAIHWALCLGGYPFFENVARVTGQLLAFHDEARLAEVQRRLVEGWGERAVVRRGAQRVVRSIIDWGVLRDGGRRGSYARTAKTECSLPTACRLLVEGLLLARPEEALPAATLRSHPSLFPFRVEVGDLGLLRGDGPVRLEREALGAEYVRLLGS
jgi:hypothetical protein